jgi:hypothetical protein
MESGEIYDGGKDRKGKAIMETDLKQVCENCMFILRPFRKDFRDTYQCKKVGKLVELTNGELCPFFKRFNEDEWRVMAFGI